MFIEQSKTLKAQISIKCISTTLQATKCTIAHCLVFHKSKIEALHESINSKGRLKMMIVKRKMQQHHSWSR